MPSAGTTIDGWPFVRTLITLEEVDSTSDRAAELVYKGSVALPLAIWARRQTRGRGRGSHAWWSDAGSLTLTIAIDPAAHGLAVESEPKLALATAAAVIDAVGELGLRTPPLGIRWPNDLESDGRKLGGILPERIETPNGHRILVGVGLNVLTDLGGAPAEVRAMATSLAEMQGEPLEAAIVPRLLSAILRRFELVLERLVNGDAELARHWSRLDLLRDRWVSVDLGTRIVAGQGCGIDPDGAFCLDDGRQRLRIFGGQVLRESLTRDEPVG
jgi:BirA family biotin operon repressor/biotin-[acetyl-CoA-carboxylase] ligase